MVNKEILPSVLESLLFISGDGLKTSDICEQLQIDKKDLDKAINVLKEKYSGDCGIHLISYNGKLQFSTNKANVDLISVVLNPIKEKDLSNAALETIAIIAYRQPVTRLEVEQIRGNNSDYTIQQLLKHNLIEVVGRKDSVGKPLLFGTTEEFLKRFQVESLADLPDYDTLLNSIKVLESGEKKEDESESSDGLYRDFEIPDEEVVLPEVEELPEHLKGEEVVTIIATEE